MFQHSLLGNYILLGKALLLEYDRSHRTMGNVPEFGGFVHFSRCTPSNRYLSTLLIIYIQQTKLLVLYIHTMNHPSIFCNSHFPLITVFQGVQQIIQ